MRPNPERLSGPDSDTSTDASDSDCEKIDDGKEADPAKVAFHFLKTGV